MIEILVNTRNVATALPLGWENGDHLEMRCDFVFALTALVVSVEDATPATISETANLSRIPPLPRLRARGGTSVSGISSGADFAVYFAIAHSSSVLG